MRWLKRLPNRVEQTYYKSVRPEETVFIYNYSLFVFINPNICICGLCLEITGIIRCHSCLRTIQMQGGFSILIFINRMVCVRGSSVCIDLFNESFDWNMSWCVLKT